MGTGEVGRLSDGEDGKEVTAGQEGMDSAKTKQARE